MKKIVQIVLFLTAQERNISKIEFEGLKRTKARFLERLIKSKVDEAYDEDKVAEDVERLKRLPGIAYAEAKTQEDSQGIGVTYTIEENFTLIPGARIATAPDESFAYRLSLFEFNFLGNNQLVGGFFERNVFNSFGFFWDSKFWVS